MSDHVAPVESAFFLGQALNPPQPKLLLVAERAAKVDTAVTPTSVPKLLVQRLLIGSIEVFGAAHVIAG